MRKLNVGLIIGIVFAVAINIAQFFFWKNLNAETAAKYTTSIAQLEQRLASFGTEVTVYTVQNVVKAGDQILPENLVPMTTYSALMTDQYVINPQDITERFFKIAVNPGTVITYNMVMDEELDDSMRDYDIVVDNFTVGLKPGDYVDVRMTMPYGDDYIVLSHKRIQEINESTIKLYLTELEWNIYLGATVDWALNKDYGVTLYMTRYIEPGLQASAVNYYAVPTNIAALLQKNPNIVDKEEAYSLNDWRRSIEELLVIFRTTDDTVEADAGKLSSHRDEMSEAVSGDAQTRLEEDKAAAEAAAANQGYTDTSDPYDDYWNSSVD